MIRIAAEVTAQTCGSEELRALLDRLFQPHLIAQGNDDPETEVISQTLLARDTTDWVRGEAAESDELALFLCARNSVYRNANISGRVAQMWLWPFFFERFPLGQIWVLEMDEDWVYGAGATMDSIAREVGYSDPQGMPGWSEPHGFSGVTSPWLPSMVLNLGAWGIYPLVLCAFDFADSSVAFLYIPDRAFQHSQVLDAGTVHSQALFSFHHVYDDQWTFDGSRGPKSKASAVGLNPLHCLGYFKWLIARLAERMGDLSQIEAPSTREQLCMTVNRAICDACLCAITELPYVAKMLFFGCLDKLANVTQQLDRAKKENEAWEMLVSTEFLVSEVMPVADAIGGNMGAELRSTIEWVAEQLRLDGLSPSDLRSLRNSQHGYALHREQWPDLARKTGEVHNDITLLATPLILYFLSRRWVPA